jgi:hypothetical protein
MDGAGKWHTVGACDGHRADLDAVQRITETESGLSGGRSRADEDREGAHPGMFLALDGKH